MDAGALHRHRRSNGKYAHVYTFRDGLVVHWKLFMSESDALAPAGLPQDDADAGRYR
jgi:hypothetical protein